MNLLGAIISFCVGIAIYFALPFDPVVKYPIILSLLAIINFFLWHKKSIFLSATFAFIFGFFYSVFFTNFTDIPKIPYTLRDIKISGVVKNIDYTPDKVRMFITTKIPGNETDALIRVSTDRTEYSPNIGDLVQGTVTLFPPDPPDVPGGFDYAKWAHFNGITATGYMTDYKVTEKSQSMGMAALRDGLHKKFDSKLFDSLVLGYKHSLDKSENDVWKSTGVAHVFSISGFHITLVGGWLFAIFYFLFRSITSLSRRIPARFPATVCAWAGLLFYLFLSGLDVATIRAFLMTSLVFFALIVGRNVFSIRNAGLVFAALLISNPHYLLEPGFQLSFSAIFGLIWIFGDAKYKKLSFIRKAWKAFWVMIVSSLVCSLFTAPFIAYHFHSVQIYSLVGNLICLPIFSLVIMPLVMLGRVESAEYVYNQIYNVAQWINELPHANLQVPMFSGFVLLIFVAGLLYLLRFGRTKLVPPIIIFLIGIAAIIFTPRPVFYASPDMELIGFVQDGQLMFNRGKSSSHYFTFDSWKQRNFEAPGTDHSRIKCNKGWCDIKTENWSLGYTQRFLPLARNIEHACNNKTYLVSYLNIEAANCKAKIIRGGFVIYESGLIQPTITGRKWH